jgi:hypothetical protein
VVWCIELEQDLHIGLAYSYAGEVIASCYCGRVYHVVMKVQAHVRERGGV